MPREKVVGIVGVKDSVKHKFVDRLLTYYDYKLVDVNAFSEIEGLSGILFLKTEESMIFDAAEKGIPFLLDTPFSKDIESELAILRRLLSKGARFILTHPSRHHPKLVCVKRLADNGVFGRIGAIHLTTFYMKNYARDVKFRKSNISGKIVYCLLNAIDFLSWIYRAQPSNTGCWIVKKGSREVIVLNSEFEDKIGSATSYLVDSTSNPSGVDVIIELTGFKRFLAWDTTEQVLLFRDDNNVKPIYWGIGIEDLIARKFIELVEGREFREEMSEIVNSYQSTIDILKLAKISEVK